MLDFFKNLFAEQVLGPIIGIVVTTLLGWVAVGYSQLTGRQLEATHRVALQSALENGIKGAIQRLLAGKLSADGTVPAAMKVQVLDEAAKYVERSVPDAVKHFDLNSISLTNLLLPKLPIGNEDVVTVAPAASVKAKGKTAADKWDETK